MEKTCAACKITKPVEEFHKDRSKKDGLNLYCKPCTIAKQKVFQTRPPRETLPGGQKRCQHCKEIKTPGDFFAAAETYDGLSRRCKVCATENHDKWRRKNLPYMREASKKWRSKNPRLAKDHKLKSTYGIPIGTYERLLTEQQGCCAICQTSDPGGMGDFHVDHDHETKAVRGLLCHNCNVGLGHFKSSGGILQQAIEYLLHYTTSRTFR